MIVLEDAVDGQSDLTFESLNSDDDLPFSVDGLPLSYDALPGSSEGRPGSSEGLSKEGRKSSGIIEEVEGLNGGEGGAPPWKLWTLLNGTGCSHENCAWGRFSWKINEFLCSIFPLGKENLEYT
jgi:hypothetical protein